LKFSPFPSLLFLFSLLVTFEEPEKLIIIDHKNDNGHILAMSLRSRSQRAAVKKAVDYIDWSSDEDEGEVPWKGAEDDRSSQPASEDCASSSEGPDTNVWSLRLVVIDDEERRYELVGEPLDAPLPPLIKKTPPEGKGEGEGGTQSGDPPPNDREIETNGAVTEAGNAPPPAVAVTGAKGRAKETFYAAMKELEGGQNIGFLEGWWFCLRADDPTQPLALGGNKKKLTRFPTEGLISCFLSYGPPNVPPTQRTVPLSSPFFSQSRRRLQLIHCHR
jgi:hypothetical protein